MRFREFLCIVLVFLFAVAGCLFSYRISLFKSEDDFLALTEQQQMGQTLIITSKTCPDCRAIKTDLFFLKLKNPDIYHIDKDSPKGKEVLKKYPVTWVPSGVYISREAYSTRRLDKHIENKIVFDTNSWNELMGIKAHLEERTSL